MSKIDDRLERARKENQENHTVKGWRVTYEQDVTQLRTDLAAAEKSFKVSQSDLQGALDIADVHYWDGRKLREDEFKQLKAELVVVREEYINLKLRHIDTQADLKLCKDALEKKIVRCCGTCDSFGFNKVFQFNNDGRCPFDSKGHRKTDCCDKWNIEALSPKEPPNET